MRTLPEALAQKLAAGAATLCRCWRLIRADGAVLGFTDHDRDLMIEGQLFEATDGFETTTIERSAGLNAQGGEIRGVLSSDRIRAQDVEAGLYDSARIEAFLVDWEAPHLDLMLDTAWLGEIRRRDGQFIAETRDSFAKWNEPRGRLYTSSCTARFADAACTLAAQDYTDTFIVSEVVSPREYIGTFAVPRPPDYFTLGQASMPQSAYPGLTIMIEAQDASRIRLLRAPPEALLAGAEMSLLAGCDKRFVTCRDRFVNAVNFRGFPHIPAPEAIFTYAVPGEGRHKGRPLVR